MGDGQGERVLLGEPRERARHIRRTRGQSRRGVESQALQGPQGFRFGLPTGPENRGSLEGVRNPSVYLCFPGDTLPWGIVFILEGEGGWGGGRALPHCPAHLALTTWAEISTWHCRFLFTCLSPTGTFPPSSSLSPKSLAWHVG